MKKRFTIMALLLCFGIIFIGCSENKNDNVDNISNEDKANQVSVTISNISSQKMKDELKNLLSENKINNANIDRYMNYINDFNGRVEDPKLLKDEFVTVDSINGIYDSISLKDKGSENNNTINEVNCRLASFELFNQFVTTKGNIDPDNYLMLDIDAMDKNPIFSFTKEDKEKYINLFNPVNIGDAKDPNEIAKLIKEELNKREVKISNNGKVSLINIYINDEIENKMFVGHSVIMIEKDKEFIVVEKFSPLAPFQMSKFQSKDDVKKYLSSRNDIYGSEIQPVFFMNNEEF